MMWAKWCLPEERFSFSEEDNGGVKISKEYHSLLFQGQSNGKRIISDGNGNPILSDPLPLTPEQIMDVYEKAIQNHLDSAAVLKGYDSIRTAVTYAEEPIVAKFQSDGKAFRKWRSLVWAYAYEQLDLVLSGQRTMPTVEEFISELPALEV